MMARTGDLNDMLNNMNCHESNSSISSVSSNGSGSSSMDSHANANGNGKRPTSPASNGSGTNDSSSAPFGQLRSSSRKRFKSEPEVGGQKHHHQQQQQQAHLRLFAPAHQIKESNNDDDDDDEDDEDEDDLSGEDIIVEVVGGSGGPESPAGSSHLIGHAQQLAEAAQQAAAAAVSQYETVRIGSYLSSGGAGKALQQHQQQNAQSGAPGRLKQESDTQVSPQTGQTLQQNQQQQQQANQQQQQSQSQSQEDNKPKRNPYCSRCRNHGKAAQVKGHKRHCEYRDCQCEGCKLVECRQIVSAAQIKRRRYQKQDEECGRRIEISPPVLRRGPDSDPVTLITKTLVSSASKHFGSVSEAAAKQLVGVSGLAGHNSGALSVPVGSTMAARSLPAFALGHTTHQFPPPPTSGSSSSSSSSNSSSSSSSTSVGATGCQGSTVSSRGPGSLVLSSSSSRAISAIAGLAAAGSGSSNPLAAPHQPQSQHNLLLTHPHLQEQHHQQQTQQQQQQLHQTQANSGHQQVTCRNNQRQTMPNPQQATANSALGNALQFLQIPNMLSAAAAAASLVAGNQHGLSPSSPHLALPGNPLQPLAGPPHPLSLNQAAMVAGFHPSVIMGPPPLGGHFLERAGSEGPSPGFREQLAIVDEIYQTFGALAIYAWLRAEQFDLHKVRESIEHSRIPFEELISGFSPLNLSSTNVD